MKNPLAVSLFKQDLLTALYLVVISVCGLVPGLATASQDRITVIVSILPQVWFAEEIGGDRVEVAALVGPGHSPATFEPTTRQMVQLQGAAAFFSAGVPFELGLLSRIQANPHAPPVFGPRPTPRGKSSHDHDHGLDPHTWLDPELAMAMADTIGSALANLIPDQATYFLQRTAELKIRLRLLREEVAAILEPVRGQTFYVFHPAYGHFARAFGLHQVAVEAQGHQPGPRQLAAVIDQVRKSQAPFIVVQPQFSKKSARAIARATGAEILVLDPLARRYDENLRFIARNLKNQLSRKKP